MKVAELLNLRRKNWQELEGLCARLANRRAATLRAEEVSRFAALYRAACADLALADAYQLPPNTVQYLHLLVGRAHNQLYRTRRFAFAAWSRTAAGRSAAADLPGSVRASGFLSVLGRVPAVGVPGVFQRRLAAVRRSGVDQRRDRRVGDELPESRRRPRSGSRSDDGRFLYSAQHGHWAEVLRRRFGGDSRRCRHHLQRGVPGGGFRVHGSAGCRPGPELLPFCDRTRPL